MELFKKYFSEVDNCYVREFGENFLICENGKIIRIKYWNKSVREYVKQTEHNGYLVVGLCNKQYRVHRLVAQAFIDNPNNKPQVNHIGILVWSYHYIYQIFYNLIQFSKSVLYFH